MTRPVFARGIGTSPAGPPGPASTVPGPAGPVGDSGPQGLPGVNAVANDTATASYIASPTSATATALSTSTARVVQRYAPIGSIKPDVRRAFPARGQERAVIGTNVNEGDLSNRKYHLLQPDNTGPIVFHGSLSAEVNGTVTTTEAGTIPAYTASENGIAFPSAFPAGPFVNEVITDAPLLHFVGNMGAAYEVYVDDEFQTIVVPDGRRQSLDWLGVRRPRHYRLLFNTGGGLAAVCTAKTDSVWAPTPEAFPLLGIMGDSYMTTGVGITATRACASIPHIIGRVLGVRLAVSGFGGSGWLTRSSGGQNNALDRIGRFADLPLSGMVFMLGINDSAAGLQAQAEAVMTAFREDHPDVPMYVQGPWYPNTAAEAAYAPGRLALTAASAAMGAVFIDNRGWITGSGRAGEASEGTAANLVGDGNADVMIGDGTHPSQGNNGPGSIYLGLRAAEALTRAIGVTA